LFRVFEQNFSAIGPGDRPGIGLHICVVPQGCTCTIYCRLCRCRSIQPPPALLSKIARAGGRGVGYCRMHGTPGQWISPLQGAATVWLPVVGFISFLASPYAIEFIPFGGMEEVSVFELASKW